jgi:cytochrome bd-type quinol oxidase subunit 2
MIMDFLAGVVCGLVMGTVLLGAAMYVLWSRGDIYERLSKSLPSGISPTLVMLAFVAAVPPTSGLAGGLAGLLYNIAEDSAPDAGLGSPNMVFTAVVLGLVTAVALALLLARRKASPTALVVLAAVAVIFGWILPLLADWR